MGLTAFVVGSLLLSYPALHVARSRRCQVRAQAKAQLPEIVETIQTQVNQGQDVHDLLARACTCHDDIKRRWWE